MSRNRLQILYNVLEREFSAAEEVFLQAEKSRQLLKDDYQKILETVTGAKTSLGRYPQAASIKRIGLIETLLKDLLLRHETERRHVNALAFLLSRLRVNLASEMLEPKLYNKIREALVEEENLRHLRARFPEADAEIPAQARKPTARTIRLALVKISGIHYAIPVKRLKRKAPNTLAYVDLKDKAKTVDYEEYFTPVEIPLKMFREKATHTPVIPFVAEEYRGDDAEPSSAQVSAQRPPWRTHLQFYGRHFFLYGARLSHVAVRKGGRTNSHNSNTPQR